LATVTAWPSRRCIASRAASDTLQTIRVRTYALILNWKATKQDGSHTPGEHQTWPLWPRWDTCSEQLPTTVKIPEIVLAPCRRFSTTRGDQSFAVGRSWPRRAAQQRSHLLYKIEAACNCSMRSAGCKQASTWQQLGSVLQHHATLCSRLQRQGECSLQALAAN
jgi:hypothetical protein